MTTEQYQEIRAELNSLHKDATSVKVDVAVMRKDIEHIRELLANGTAGNRYWTTTVISVLAVAISIGAVIWT